MQDRIHSNERYKPPTETTTNHKGGRPRKKKSEKKSVTYSAHTTAFDALMIEAKRKQSGLCKSEFTLASLLSVRVIARLPMQVMDWLRDIAGMANNINQLAKEAHTRGYASVHNRLTALAESIENLITQIYNYKEEQ
ncbi:MAG: plasmid mobilization relaxosome protein MobC [Prevotella sp.]|nr:plasmid mobilization relaxosome protein MobC [Prevotella sp.]